MRLSEYLSVPYLLEAETVEIGPGSWVRRVAYPELPDCSAEALVVEEALLALERRRIEMIVRMVGEGRQPPVPRPPLRDCDPGWVAKQAGLPDDIVALIDRDRTAIPRATISDVIEGKKSPGKERRCFRTKTMKRWFG